MKFVPPPKAGKHVRASDLVGVARLATQAVDGVTRIAEGVHQSVRSTMGLPGGTRQEQTGGITGLVYKSILGTNDLVGKALERAAQRLQPMLESVVDVRTGSPEREAVLAALNGVMGDRLAAAGNPLATPMTLRCHGQVLCWPMEASLPQLSGKVLLMIHGLCMNDLQWSTSHAGQSVDHGRALAAALGATLVCVRYNSGLHTSDNGSALAAQLDALVANWPVPVEEIVVVGHSMGGLIIRSACHAACAQQQAWLERLTKVVFLGTPHHGAPLERAGNWVDVLLGATRYTAPFARLAQLRSAGITDLRYGHLVQQDWIGRDRFRRTPDRRQNIALPPGVACYVIAATLAAKRGALAERLIGDGLVPLRSALGVHDDPSRTLDFPPTSQAIFYRTNHMELLASPPVLRQMLLWLGAPMT